MTMSLRLWLPWRLFAESEGYETDIRDERYHHEIYLSDPRKCDPAKMKTVVRHPIKKEGRKMNIEEVVKILYSKNSKEAYAALKVLLNVSAQSDELYPYFDQFVAMSEDADSTSGPEDYCSSLPTPGGTKTTRLTSASTSC